MSVRSLRVGLLLFLAGSVVSGGCGSGNPKEVSKTAATVTGKVTASGAPVSKGWVTVTTPRPPYVENKVEIRKDGTYEIKTFVGMNSFSVTGTGYPAQPGTYDKAGFEVKEGSNTIDLALPLRDK
jgi:hypothetical protein